MTLSALAVTTDVNGTLIHCPRLAEIYAEVLERHGVSLEVSAIRETFPSVWQEFECLRRLDADRYSADPQGARGWWTRLVGRLCQRLGSLPPSPFAAAELFQRFALAESWEVYPEARAVLDGLRGRGFRLAAIGNWDHRLPALLDALGLASFFDAVIHSSAVGVEKPHPRIFRRTLEILGVPPRLAVHVGDSRRADVEGALGAGMKGLLLNRGGGGDIRDLSELGSLVAHAAAEHFERR